MRTLLAFAMRNDPPVKGPELRLVNNTQGLVEAAREIAKERRELLMKLCDAVLNHDHAEAERLAKQLTGK
jgi:hypothetical protein